MIRNPKMVKAIAFYFLIQFTTSIIFPSVSYALTSGPSQPEFSSFEPVSSTNMVDEFSGDFTYNLPILEVPGPQGSGYPISLSYHSGTSPEEESSWVGYGWTLNAGAINRGIRGLPDDYKGKNVTFYNKTPKNWTGTVGGSVGFGEVFGFDLQKLAGAQLSANVALRYNNYRGFGYNAGVGVSLGRGLVSMGYNVSDGSGSFSLNLNPYAALRYSVSKEEEVRTVNRKRYDPKADNYANEAMRDMAKSGPIGSKGAQFAGSTYGIFSYTHASKPNVVGEYTGKSFNVSVGLEGNVAIVPVGATGNVFGSYSYQQNTPERIVSSYGFMYAAESSKNDLMDYHVEQEKDFNKRDVFLGVPFNDADNFIVSGEGIGGGFRLYNRTAGHFGPKEVISKTDIYNVGGEIGAGWTFGPGVDVGKGSHTLTVNDWNRNLSSFTKNDGNTDEAIFFRFNNDLGGEWGTNHDDLPFKADVSRGGNVSLPSGKEKYNMDNNVRTGRSSYIGYHTNQDMIDGSGSPSYMAYSRNTYINAQANRTNAEGNDLIGELAVFNEAGNRYIYGLPVYTKNERNLSYSANGLERIDNNYIGYTSSPNTSMKVGEEKTTPYATTYLLTEITTPDYVDRGTSGEYGPSLDDLGGYTRFNYSKQSSAYHWRAPFKGMTYMRNSHSDPLDDMVSYSEGDKEIYYLKSIETKTHIAIFNTGDRKDGLEAADNAFSSNAGSGDVKLRRLESIALYTIDDFEKDSSGKLSRDNEGNPQLKSNATAIKVVYFDYDYTLSEGLPNSSEGKGKLTLKRVYSEYNGVHKVRINPYEFKYEYPSVAEYNAFPDNYKPGGLYDVVTGYTNFDNQNPAYSPFLADAWGSYQRGGDARFKNMMPWVSQVPNSNQQSAQFDPAVWQLKIIKLPSGGEIHVQYEQDDYSYVQDQEAHVMASLANPAEAGLNEFIIDVSSIGITSASDLQQLKAMIDDRYVTKKKNIYFKFLYRLIGNNDFDNTDADFNTCNAEFITGYVPVLSCSILNGNIVLTLGGDRPPDEVCKDFVKANRLGKIYPGQDCNPATGVSDPNDAKALVNQLLSLAAGMVVPGTLCEKISYSHSYFRIPTPLGKKGGGIRVKRLMTFDKGLDNIPVLYGSEYIYKTQDGNGRVISSGVATNEPQAIREENILVDFVARKNQNTWSKIVAGKDKEQSEGPIGESVLPGASVGYSRVIVRNIYGGKTSPGFSISDFYTAKDYPVSLGKPDDRKTMTDIRRETNNPIPIVIPFHTKIKNKTSAAQGFSFVLNNMHGQPRRNASYAGIYNGSIGNNKEVNSISYEYFSPGEKVPMMSSLYSGIVKKNPGREVDITFAQRNVHEVSNDVNVEGDLQLTVIPLAFVVLVIPYPTAVPSFSYIEGELRTHSTTKVVRYPAIVKKTTIMQDGISHEEENLAFDAYTGKSVAVRSTDEFKGAYLSQSIPASWQYPDMGGKWKSEGKKITGSFTFTSGIVNLGTDPCLLAEFSRGDIIRLGSAPTALYYITGKDYMNNNLLIEKSTSNSTAPTGSFDITITHTGRTNQLQQQAGAITFHNERKENLAVPVVDQTNRYEKTDDTNNPPANNFAIDLQAATTGLSNTDGQFSLSGTYPHLDMSGFADKLSSCVVDLTDVTVSNLQFLYTIENGQIKLQLMKFTIDCAGTPVIIKADGWE